LPNCTIYEEAKGFVDVHAREWKEMKCDNNFEATKPPVCAPMWGSEQNLKKAVGDLRL